MNDIATESITLRVPGLSRELGLFVHGEQDRFVSRCLREEGVWEPFETSLVTAVLAEGDVFVDVGANIGYFSLLAADRVGDSGAVYAFEPDPENHALLCASAAANGLHHVIHPQAAALAASDGQAMLYLSEDNLGDHQIFATPEQRSAVPVRLLSGSGFLDGRVQRIDLVKIDTQGSEYGVMKGLLPLLHSLPAPPRIIIELTPLSLRQCGSSGRQLIELLAKLEQPMWIIDHLEHRLVASSAEELAAWCDAVDAVPGDAGFMNILVGADVPLQGTNPR